MLNCFTCGTWIKPDKYGIYKCKKCKAKWTKDKDRNIIRVYDNKEVKENNLWDNLGQQA